MDSLWQIIYGAVGNWIADLLGIVGAVMIGFLKSKRPNWAVPLLYGLCAFAFLELAYYAVDARHTLLSEHAAITNTANVQDKVRTWLDTFGLNARYVPESNSYFRYDITMINGHGITVCRLKEPQAQSVYLMVGGNLVPNIALADSLNKMSEIELRNLTRQFGIEAARQKMSYSSVNAKTGVILQKRLPIGAMLTEDLFYEAIDNMDASLTIIDVMYEAIQCKQESSTSRKQ